MNRYEFVLVYEYRGVERKAVYKIAYGSNVVEAGKIAKNALTPVERSGLIGLECVTLNAN